MAKEYHHIIGDRKKMITSSIMTIKHETIGLALAALVAVIFILILETNNVNGFIKFGYILNTTACDTCDELRTYSGRNVFCCLAQSKCCGPNSLDELEASLTTVVPPS